MIELELRSVIGLELGRVIGLELGSMIRLELGSMIGLELRGRMVGLGLGERRAWSRWRGRHGGLLRILFRILFHILFCRHFLCHEHSRDRAFWNLVVPELIRDLAVPS